MAIARSRLIDVSITRWYHCITRCVRRAFLLGEGTSDRREWLEKRIQELAQKPFVDMHCVGIGSYRPIHRAYLNADAFYDACPRGRLRRQWLSGSHTRLQTLS